MPENDTVVTLEELEVVGEKIDADKENKWLAGLGSKVWRTIGKSLGIYALAKGLIGTKRQVEEGKEPYQVDIKQLAIEAFGAQSMLLDLILDKESDIRGGFQDVSNELLAGNYNYIVKTQAESQGKIDEIIAKSRSSERLSQMGDVNSPIGQEVRKAVRSTPEGQRYLGAVAGLTESNLFARWQASGSSKTFDEWERDREPAATRGGDFDDAPAIDEPVDIDPQLARFIEGKGEVAKLHQAMLDSPSNVSQGTEGYQLGQEWGGGIITGFTPEGAPQQSGNATPDTLKALRDYVAGEGPIAEYLAQLDQSDEQAIDDPGHTFDHAGEPVIAGLAPHRPPNPTLDPHLFAPQGGGGVTGGAGGGVGGGGAQGFGYAPFGNLGGRILPGLESAAMTQPFRPLLGSLNQQAMFPGVSPITQSLFQGALEELPLGGALTPGQQRDIEQQSFEIAERQGNLRSRPAAFAALLNTDQAKQIRQRERQNYAAGVNQMAQQERERNRSLALNVEARNQGALGQDRQFGLGVGTLLGGLNLSGQELALRGGIAGAQLGQRAQQIEQDKVNQARNYLLNSISPFSQAAQAVNPMQVLGIPGTTGLDFAQNQQNLAYNMLSTAKPYLYQPFDPYGFQQANVESGYKTDEANYANQQDYLSTLMQVGKGIFDYSGFNPSSDQKKTSNINLPWPFKRKRLDDPESIQQAGFTDLEEMDLQYR